MRRPRGFTLLETVVAGVLAAGVFYTLLAAWPTTLMSLRKGHDLSVASNLAQRTMEELRQTSFDQLVDGTTSPAPVVLESTEYRLETRVSTASPDLKNLQVQVSWRSSQARTGQERLMLNTCIYRFRNP